MTYLKSVAAEQRRLRQRLGPERPGRRRGRCREREEGGAETDARTWYRKLVGNETATKWPEKAIATEYERAALNAYAAGIEPARVSKTQNLIAGILSFYQPEHPGYYGEPEVFEGTVFGLLALADAKTRKASSAYPKRC